MTNVPSSDYSIRVSSSTNATIYGASASPFSIVDAPSVNTGSVARLADGRVQFGITAPGAATVTVLGSTNLVNWQAVQTLTPVSGSVTFTDSAAPVFPTRFYRLAWRC